MRKLVLRHEASAAAEMAWCSWCYEKAAHGQVNESKFLGLQRALMECANCGCQTARCNFPGCTNMARFGEDARDFMCAIHNGTIKSFETVNQRIKDPIEFSRIFLRRDGVDFARLSKRGAVVVGSVMAVLLSGGAAGAFLSAAAGAAVGGRMGSRLADRFFGDIQEFEFQRIRDGSDPAIILIDGFLTERTQTQESWLTGLGSYGQGRAVYRLRWESQTLQSAAAMAQTLAMAGGVSSDGASEASAAAADGAAMTGSILSAAASAIGPLQTIGLANLTVGNPWAIALVRSEQAGQLLADMLRRCSGRSFDLVGHSLGARVIFYALSALAGAARTTDAAAKPARVVDVHLLGGALGNGPAESWQDALGAIEGRCHSYYSTTDRVLKYLYPPGVGFQSEPIGRAPIATTPATAGRIQSLDVSEIVKGHDLYHSSLAAVLARSAPLPKRGFWQRLFGSG